MTVPVDRLCLACGQREVIGDPLLRQSVYVCWECYFLGCDCGHIAGSPACRARHEADA